MRINSVNLTISKKNSIAFGENEVVRDEMIDAFPFGVKVDVSKTNAELWIIRFPDDNPLPGNVARRVVDNKTVIAYSNAADGKPRRLDIPRYLDTVDTLYLKTRNAALDVARALREFVQAQAQKRLKAMAILEDLSIEAARIP